jgi:hypothetical protein
MCHGRGDNEGLLIALVSTRWERRTYDEALVRLLVYSERCDARLSCTFWVKDASIRLYTFLSCFFHVLRCFRYPGSQSE